MGWYDYLSDLAGSLTIQSAEAEQANAGPADKSGEQSSGVDTRSGGVGNAQHDRGATTRGGVSTKSPASGTNEESASEAEVNKQDEKPKDDGKNAGSDDDDAAASSEAGGDDEGGEDAGEDGEGEAEEEEEEEEEEDDDEPVCPKDKLEEDCMKTQQCAPLKHHYDECAERVQQQEEKDGKAHEDCVEEFFHLMHCATQCAAPKLFKQLR